MIIKGYVFGVLYGVACLFLALVAYKLGMSKKHSRKLVHILVGAEWIILYHYMGATYHFLIVCVAFLVLLTLSHFMKLMPMISSDEDNAPGTIYYAVAMTVMATVCLFLPKMMLPFGIGVMCTSLGDGFAGVAGQSIKAHNPKIYGKKTLLGSLANFIFSSGAAIAFKYIFDMELKIWQCLLIGLFSVGLELITVFGLDNITITLGTAFLSFAFVNLPLINNFVIPIVATPFIIALVLEKRVLTKGGLALALILDAVVSLTLANFGFVLLISFLVFSVVVDKIKDHKKLTDTITKKGDCRDAVQVVANGLVPMIMAILFSVTFNKIFVVGYIAALAEALADTVASGVGVYSRSTFDVFKMRKATRGISGGMSLIGTGFSLIGALVISAIALAFGAIDLKLMLVVTLAAFLGAVFDSFLGSVFQIKYTCSVCNQITERTEHCGKPTVKHSGFEFFDNDVVNLFGGAFAAVVAIIFTIVI